MPVRVQTEDFDLTAEVAALRARNPKIGAVACFVGTVRDLNEGASVETMELEHYPGMTEKSLEAIVVSAQERWPGIEVLVINNRGARQVDVEPWPTVPPGGGPDGVLEGL